MQFFVLTDSKIPAIYNRMRRTGLCTNSAACAFGIINLRKVVVYLYSAFRTLAFAYFAGYAANFADFFRGFAYRS